MCLESPAGRERSRGKGHAGGKEEKEKTSPDVSPRPPPGLTVRVSLLPVTSLQPLSVHSHSLPCVSSVSLIPVLGVCLLRPPALRVCGCQGERERESVLVCCVLGCPVLVIDSQHPRTCVCLCLRLTKRSPGHGILDPNKRSMT